MDKPTIWNQAPKEQSRALYSPDDTTFHLCLENDEKCVSKPLGIKAVQEGIIDIKNKNSTHKRFYLGMHISIGREKVQMFCSS